MIVDKSSEDDLYEEEEITIKFKNAQWSGIVDLQEQHGDVIGPMSIKDDLKLVRMSIQLLEKDQNDQWAPLFKPDEVCPLKI